MDKYTKVIAVLEEDGDYDLVDSVESLMNEVNSAMRPYHKQKERAVDPALRRKRAKYYLKHKQEIRKRQEKYRKLHEKELEKRQEKYQA